MIHKAPHYRGQSPATGRERFFFINFPSQLADKISCHLPWSASYVMPGLGGPSPSPHPHRKVSLGRITLPSLPSLHIRLRGICSFINGEMSQVPEYCNNICKEIFHCLCGQIENVRNNWPPGASCSTYDLCS